MFDPDAWMRVGVHWHAYVEVRGDQPFPPISTRESRLLEAPDLVLTTPDAVAEWLAGMTRKHAHPEPVRLIGPNGGLGHIGDDGHIEHDQETSIEVASRGNSLYLDFPREQDRMHLWVEAVTAEDCKEVHDEQE